MARRSRTIGDLFAAIGVALAVFGVGLHHARLHALAAPRRARGAVAHLGGGAQWTLSSYGLQRIVPDRIRGRIFAFDAALITLTLVYRVGWSVDGLDRTASDVTGPQADGGRPRPGAIAWAGHLDLAHDRRPTGRR